MKIEFEELEEEEIRETPDAEDTEDLEEQDIPEYLVALLKAPTERSWREAELVDIWRHPKYEAQASFATNPDTGEALRDDDGNLIRCPRNQLGAQVPDGFYEDELGEIHIREVKTPEDKHKLMGEMAVQAYNRLRAFGTGIDLVFAISPKYTVAEAEEIQDFANRMLKAEVDYQMK